MLPKHTCPIADIPKESKGIVGRNVDAYARKMAAKAARPATAMELPKELAEPWKGVIGEVEGLDAALEYLLAFKP